MKQIIKKILNILIIISLFIQLSACGTLLYPERRGQTSGRIDPGVAVMDGVCLLLFIIPGVFAYVVDFSTGAIYLPGGRHRDHSHRDQYSGKDENPDYYADGIKVVHVNPDRLNEETIKKIVIRETGMSGSIDFNHAKIRSLKRLADIPLKLARMEKAHYRIQ